MYWVSEKKYMHLAPNEFLMSLGCVIIFQDC